MSLSSSFGAAESETPKQSASSSTPLEKLLTINRISTNSLLSQVLLIIYLPIGIVVFLLRLAIALHVFILSCITRKASVLRCTALRVMCCVLGVLIKEEGQVDEDAKLIVANHISVVDHSVMELIRPCVLPSVWDLPPLLTWAFGYADLGALRGRDVLIENAKKFIRDEPLPLLAFPEGALTNGQVGLLRFSSWPFHVCARVQPALISAHRPVPLGIQLSCMGSRWWTDILWLLFCPMTVFRVRWLAAAEQQSDSADQFAANVQLAIANTGGLSATQHTSRDIVDYAKRRVLEERELRAQAQRQQLQRQRAQRTQHVSRNVQATVELDRMTLKVKEVLPQVPLQIIRQDIEITRSVDETTSNLAQEPMDYPEPEVTVNLKTMPADLAGWSSVFEARKWAMIELNRAAYIKTHNLSSQ